MNRLKLNTIFYSYSIFICTSASSIVTAALYTVSKVLIVSAHNFIKEHNSMLSETEFVTSSCAVAHCSLSRRARLQAANSGWWSLNARPAVGGISFEFDGRGAETEYDGVLTPRMVHATHTKALVLSFMSGVWHSSQ